MIVFFFWILILLFPLLGADLNAESYSNHRFDDRLLLEGGGKNFSGLSRYSSLEKEDGRSMGLDFYIPGNYLTQKGGLDEDFESSYRSRGYLDLEFFYGKELSGIVPFLVLSPKVFLEEEYRSERNRYQKLAGEMILGLSSWEDRLFLQGGRGFQRLDRYGFLMNGEMDFLESGFRLPMDHGWIGLNLLLGKIESGDNQSENKTSHSMREETHPIQNISGLAFRGEILNRIFSWNLFHYQLLQNKTNPEYGRSFLYGENIRYTGLEIHGIIEGMKFLPGELKWELGGIGMEGFQDRYHPFYKSIENKLHHNANQYYGKLQYIQNQWMGELAGLATTRIGFSDLRNETRFMGGNGSILLNLQDYHVFLKYEESKKSGGGLYFGKEWKLGENRTINSGMFLNSIDSFYGKGREMILRIGLMSRNDWNGFLYLSIAHANINPNQNKTLWVEGWEVPEKNREYGRFFLSGGMKF